MAGAVQPRVMFYVQHLLGIGHLMRARRIASALYKNDFSVTLVTGGLPVPGFDLPGVQQVALPAMAVRDGNFSDLVDANGNKVDNAFKAERRQQLLDVYSRLHPDIVVLEAYPFGRRQLRFELLPLIDAIQSSQPKPLLVTSIRDVLQRNRKAGRDEETTNILNQYFDKVLVHGDANFATLDKTFPFAQQIADKIAYTGLVSGPTPNAPSDSFDIVVSAGGGAVGTALLRTTMQAVALIPDTTSWCVITGPYLSQPEFDALASSAPANVTLERFRTDFVNLLTKARLSISQAGYNTVNDILQAGCRALLVPYCSQGETEQADRAALLNKLGLASVLHDDAMSGNSLSGRKLADSIRDAMLQGAPTVAPALNFDGANGTAIILRHLLKEYSGQQR